MSEVKLQTKSDKEPFSGYMESVGEIFEGDYQIIKRWGEWQHENEPSYKKWTMGVYGYEKGGDPFEAIRLIYDNIKPLVLDGKRMVICTLDDQEELWDLEKHTYLVSAKIMVHDNDEFIREKNKKGIWQLYLTKTVLSDITNSCIDREGCLILNETQATYISVPQHGYCKVKKTVQFGSKDVERYALFNVNTKTFETKFVYEDIISIDETGKILVVKNGQEIEDYTIGYRETEYGSEYVTKSEWESSIIPFYKEVNDTIWGKDSLKEIATKYVDSIYSCELIEKITDIAYKYFPKHLAKRQTFSFLIHAFSHQYIHEHQEQVDNVTKEDEKEKKDFKLGVITTDEDGIEHVNKFLLNRNMVWAKNKANRIWENDEFAFSKTSSFLSYIDIDDELNSTDKSSNKDDFEMCREFVAQIEAAYGEFIPDKYDKTRAALWFLLLKFNKQYLIDNPRLIK